MNEWNFGALLLSMHLALERKETVSVRGAETLESVLYRYSRKAPHNLRTFHVAHIFGSSLDL